MAPMYGPGNAVGKRAFTINKKRQVKAAKAAKAAPKKLKNLINSLIKYNGESKYSSEQLQTQVLGQAAATPGGFVRLLPAVAQGTAENERIGDKMRPTKLQTTFSFYFPNDLQNNQDIIVNLWIVTAKGVGTAGALAGVTAGQFLKVGNGNNTDPNDPNQVNMLEVFQHYPLNTEQYTLKKHYRFRMRRGIGLPTNTNTGGEVAPTGVQANEMYKVIKWSCKPPEFKYNDVGDVQPNNFYPVALLYATNVDGSAYGDTIRYAINREIYFKDQ